MTKGTLILLILDFLQLAIMVVFGFLLISPLPCALRLRPALGPMPPPSPYLRCTVHDVVELELGRNNLYRESGQLPIYRCRRWDRR